MVQYFKDTDTDILKTKKSRHILQCMHLFPFLGINYIKTVHLFPFTLLVYCAGTIIFKMM